MYYVYIHTVPNGKIYIGQTKHPIARWNNGEGYKQNEAFYNDICIYGWNNIKHEIIAEVAEREKAQQIELSLIVLLKSENENIGYNQTSFYSDTMKLYYSRVESGGVSFEKPTSEDNFFTSCGLPVSACKEIINQWIFNEKHRNILKRRLIDGITYADLSKEFNMSIRQIKNIVAIECNSLEKHL